MSDGFEGAFGQSDIQWQLKRIAHALDMIAVVQAYHLGFVQYIPLPEMEPAPEPEPPKAAGPVEAPPTPDELPF